MKRTSLTAVCFLLAMEATVAFGAPPTVTVNFQGIVHCQAGGLAPPELQGFPVLVTVADDPLYCPGGATVSTWTDAVGGFYGSLPPGCFGTLQATIDPSGWPGDFVLFGAPVRSASAGKDNLAVFDDWVVACPGEPYAPLSDVTKLVYSPAGSLDWTLTVRDNQGDPLAYALIVVGPVDAQVDQKIGWCAGQSHNPTAIADINGTATMTIRAGGCMDPARLGRAPFKVLAEGVEFIRLGGASSDAVNHNNFLPSDPGYTFDHIGGDRVSTVGLSDAVFHTPNIKMGTDEYCSDLDGDGWVGLGDAVDLAGDISTGAFCFLD